MGTAEHAQDVEPWRRDGRKGTASTGDRRGLSLAAMMSTAMMDPLDPLLFDVGGLALAAACLAVLVWAVGKARSLRKACNKFISRFQYLEEKLQQQNKKWSETNAKELDQLWNEAKRILKLKDK